MFAPARTKSNSSKAPPRRTKTSRATTRAIRLRTLFDFNRSKLMRKRAYSDLEEKKAQADLAKNSIPEEEEEEERMFFGLLSKDNFLKGQTIMYFLYSLWKVVMATLLSLFVPQVCEADPANGFDARHSCTDKENMGLESELTKFEKFVLGWNFITLGFAVFHYMIVYKREFFLVDYLDVNHSVPADNLPKVIVDFPLMDEDLHKVNVILLGSSVWLVVIFIINAIVSGVMIFRDYYDGFRTVTVYLTNMALMGTVLETTFSHAYAGYKNRLALSCFDFDPVSFNVIDHTMLHAKDMKEAPSDRLPPAVAATLPSSYGVDAVLASGDDRQAPDRVSSLSTSIVAPPPGGVGDVNAARVNANANGNNDAIIIQDVEMGQLQD